MTLPNSGPFLPHDNQNRLETWLRELFEKTRDLALEEIKSYTSTSIDPGTGGISPGALPDLEGDVTGTIAANLVSSLQGSPVSASAPTTGEVLTWNGTEWDPAPSLATNPMTTAEDLIKGGVAGVQTRLGKGANGTVLGVVGGVVGWIAGLVANPLTTLGDLLVAAGSGVQSRLPIGTTGQVLTVVGGVPAWATTAAAATIVTNGDPDYPEVVFDNGEVVMSS